MKRDRVITVLLVLAGIILAFVLFGAGAIWNRRGSRKSSSQVVPARTRGDFATLRFSSPFHIAICRSIANNAARHTVP